MATLTPTPTQVAINTVNTMAVRLYAWYTESGGTYTAHLRLDAMCQGMAYTGTNKNYRLIFQNADTGTVSWPDSLNADTWYTISELTQTMTPGDTYYGRGIVWTYQFGETYAPGPSSVDNVALTMPGSSPTGLALSDIIPGTDGFTGTVSVTGWGTGGTTAGRHKELSVCTSNTPDQRKKVKVYEDTLSTTITVDNTATLYDGAIFTITPNTTYYLTMWASNGASGTGNSSFTQVVTKAGAPTVSLDSVTDTTAIINYSTTADGGVYTKTIEYSLDGATWTTGATITGGSASSGSFTITGLTPQTAYSVQTRTRTTAGSIAGPTLSVTTESDVKLYGSVGGQTKQIRKLYGSVNGQTKEIKKLYGSVSGQTRLIYHA